MRVVNKVGQEGWHVASSTYHAFCRKRILKPFENHDYFKSLGYNNGFIIFDDADSRSVMRSVIANLSGGQILLIDALSINDKNLLSMISNHRSEGISLAEYETTIKKQPNNIAHYQALVSSYPKEKIDKNTDIYEQFLKEIRVVVSQKPNIVDALVFQVWSKYAEYCAKADGIDFDDQILFAKQILKHDPRVAQRICHTFTHILLDEYQDTNKCQFDVIKLITDQTDAPNLFTVGDDRQSIYRFRNARVELMTEFDQHYPQCITNSLTTNYRSAPHIINFTNAHAMNMTDQIGLGQLTADKAPTGELSVYNFFRDEGDEANWVMDKVQELLDSGEKASDIAILYRNRAMNNSIVDNLKKSNIEYSIVGDTGFYESAEVKSFISTLRMVANNDVYALCKFLEYASVGVSAVRVKGVHHESGGNAFNILKTITSNDKRAANKLVPFITSLESLKLIREKLLDETGFLSAVLNDETLQKHFHENASNTVKNEIIHNYKGCRNQQIKQLVNSVKQFWELYALPSFEKKAEAKAEKSSGKLESVQILEQIFSNIEVLENKIINDYMDDNNNTFSDSVDALVQRLDVSSAEDIDSLNLMTNHASKGLEYKHIFLIGCEEESYIKETSSPEDISEESRNFFVAISRAESMLYMSGVKSRFLHGSREYRSELRFIKEINPQLYATPMKTIDSKSALIFPVEETIQVSDDDYLKELTISGF
ncbi:MAG: UvrD-helicase domain-containing protein [Endozoicomonadaceae bacterium]|nr:UvrD-helicase domain-containing protein [Endozoicomonadaceae bacterium]